jgi:hypothetical protein
VFDEMRKGLQQIEFIKQPDTRELRIGSQCDGCRFASSDHCTIFSRFPACGGPCSA